MSPIQIQLGELECDAQVARRLNIALGAISDDLPTDLGKKQDLALHYEIDIDKLRASYWFKLAGYKFQNPEDGAAELNGLDGEEGDVIDVLRRNIGDCFFEPSFGAGPGTSSRCPETFTGTGGYKWGEIWNQSESQVVQQGGTDSPAGAYNLATACSSGGEFFKGYTNGQKDDAGDDLEPGDVVEGMENSAIDNAGPMKNQYYLSSNIAAVLEGGKYSKEYPKIKTPKDETYNYTSQCNTFPNDLPSSNPYYPDTLFDRSLNIIMTSTMLANEFGEPGWQLAELVTNEQEFLKDFNKACGNIVSQYQTIIDNNAGGVVLSNAEEERVNTDSDVSRLGAEMMRAVYGQPTVGNNNALSSSNSRRSLLATLIKAANKEFSPTLDQPAVPMSVEERMKDEWKDGFRYQGDLYFPLDIREGDTFESVMTFTSLIRKVIKPADDNTTSTINSPREGLNTDLALTSSSDEFAKMSLRNIMHVVKCANPEEQDVKNAEHAVTRAVSHIQLELGQAKDSLLTSAKNMEELNQSIQDKDSALQTSEAINEQLDKTVSVLGTSALLTFKNSVRQIFKDQPALGDDTYGTAPVDSDPDTAKEALKDLMFAEVQEVTMPADPDGTVEVKLNRNQKVVAGATAAEFVKDRRNLLSTIVAFMRTYSEGMDNELAVIRSDDARTQPDIPPSSPPTPSNAKSVDGVIQWYTSSRLKTKVFGQAATETTVSSGGSFTEGNAWKYFLKSVTDINSAALASTEDKNSDGNVDAEDGLETWMWGGGALKVNDAAPTAEQAQSFFGHVIAKLKAYLANLERAVNDAEVLISECDEKLKAEEKEEEISRTREFDLKIQLAGLLGSKYENTEADNDGDLVVDDGRARANLNHQRLRKRITNNFALFKNTCSDHAMMGEIKKEIARQVQARNEAVTQKSNVETTIAGNLEILEKVLPHVPWKNVQYIQANGVPYDGTGVLGQGDLSYYSLTEAFIKNVSTEAAMIKNFKGVVDGKENLVKILDDIGDCDKYIENLNRALVQIVTTFIKITGEVKQAVDGTFDLNQATTGSIITVNTPVTITNDEGGTVTQSTSAYLKDLLQDNSELSSDFNTALNQYKSQNTNLGKNYFKRSTLVQGGVDEYGNAAFVLTNEQLQALEDDPVGPPFASDGVSDVITVIESAPDHQPLSKFWKDTFGGAKRPMDPRKIWDFGSGPSPSSALIALTQGS